MKTRPNGYWLRVFNVLSDIETDECVEWDGPNSRGYGRVFFNYKWHRATALALTKHNITQPQGKTLVLHKPEVCHNAKCLNYRHLRWGSHKDNMKDKLFDKTSMQGELHPRAKLNTEDVKFIRDSGWSDLKLSQKYEVDRKTIYAAKHNKTWRYI